MSARFEYPVTVAAEDIDELRHVNNEVYLRWMLEAATAHSDSLGYTLEKFLALGRAFVVRRHELDYLAPAFLGDTLCVETWTEGFEGPRATRLYVIRRQSDGKILLNGQTLWVFVNLKSGRPERVPEEIQAGFGIGHRHDR